jgi:hypothetical protein
METIMGTRAVDKKLIDRLRNLKNQRLTEYEVGVVESLSDFATKRGYLTEKQVKFLSNIEANYTSDAMSNRQMWLDSFDEQMRRDFRIVADYYYRQGQYFFALASKIKEDENYVPTEKIYRKLCENKYAQRVLTEHKKDPRFMVGQVVYAVSKAPSRTAHDLRRGGVVLRANAEPIDHAVKGAKKYLVLPIGDPHGIIVEERWLKSRRDKRNGESRIPF